MPTRWQPLAELSEDDHRRMWDVRRTRLSYTRLTGAGEVQGERDRFLASLAGFTHADVGRDAEGRIAYFALYRVVKAVAGDPCLHEAVLGPQYKVRGVRPSAPWLGLIRMLAGAILRHPLRGRVVLVTDVSPLGYARLLRAMRGILPVWLDGDAGTPAPLQRAMDDYVDRGGGALKEWDPEARLFRWPVVVSADVEAIERSGMRAAELERFVRRVPDPLGRNAGCTVLAGGVVNLLSGWKLLCAAVRERLLGVGRGRSPDDLRPLLEGASVGPQPV